MDKNSALPLVLLSEQFAKFPGIGIKSAQRMSYHIMSMSDDEVKALCGAIMNAHTTVHTCPVCHNLTENELCPICEDTRRDRSTVCVVESPKDISAFERTGEYNGVYHVLHGLISPMDNVTPDKLKIKELLNRLDGSIKELIMATNPTVEGEATAMYISKLVKPFGVKTTRLAFGLPVGGILEYADEITLFRALQNRNEI